MFMSCCNISLDLRNYSDINSDFLKEKKSHSTNAVKLEGSFFFF